jgi:hypothetical protein
MDYTNRGWIGSVLALGLLATMPARAATNPDLPPIITRGAITYMSGGISPEQESAMHHEAMAYSLELRFLESGRAYGAPAYVPVKIRNRSGEVVLDSSSDGPLMLAKLPDGQYTVSARYGGKTEVLRANVNHGDHRTLVFDWKG